MLQIMGRIDASINITEKLGNQQHQDEGYSKSFGKERKGIKFSYEHSLKKNPLKITAV